MRPPTLRATLPTLLGLAAAAGLDPSPSAFLSREGLRELAYDRGPVLVTVEYRVDPADRDTFVRAAGEFRRIRCRAESLTSGLYADAADEGRRAEAFVPESWLDHLSRHERLSRHGERLPAAARAFHRGPEGVRVAHLRAPSACGGPAA